MPFDHSTFDPDRATPMLVEQNMAELGPDNYPERDLCSRVPVSVRSATVPRMPRGYANGRSDKRAIIGDGDRAVVYSTHADSIQYGIRRAAAAFDITHIDRAELDTLMPGGSLAFLSLLAQRQILTEYAIDFNVIISGNGTAGDYTAVDTVAIPGGSEFNAASPAKTPEQYFREAKQVTKGDTVAMNEDVLWALLANPNLGENDLNQRSMTLDEFRGWLMARGFRNLIILMNEAQDQDPRQGYSVDYIHDDVCVVGQLKAVQYVVMNELGYYTVNDPFTKVDYLVADADYDFIVGYDSVVRCFTNTLA